MASTRSDRKSTRLNSSHITISYAVFCLKKKKRTEPTHTRNEKKNSPQRRDERLHLLCQLRDHVVVLFDRLCGVGEVEHHVVFFFNDTATTEIYTLSLHDALPI